MRYLAIGSLFVLLGGLIKYNMNYSPNKAQASQIEQSSRAGPSIDSITNQAKIPSE